MLIRVELNGGEKWEGMEEGEKSEIIRNDKFYGGV
jgi:hypothetical protein